MLSVMAIILTNYRLPSIGNGQFLFLNEIKIDHLHYENTKKEGSVYTTRFGRANNKLKKLKLYIKGIRAFAALSSFEVLRIIYIY